MGEERLALARAAAHGDTELLYLPLLHLKVLIVRVTLSFELFS